MNFTKKLTADLLPIRNEYQIDINALMKRWRIRYRAPERNTPENIEALHVQMRDRIFSKRYGSKVACIVENGWVVLQWLE